MNIEFSSKLHKQLNINSMIVEKGNPVYLNIYHLAKVNFVVQFFGFGFFHTTIEVNDYEYSFGSTTEDSCGVFFNQMSEHPTNLILKEKVFLGFTLLTQIQITQLLLLYLPFWLGKSYDPFTKNCNHFTKFLASKLLLEKSFYPEYVNRLSQYGILFAGFYSPIKRIYGNIVYRPDSNSRMEIPSTLTQQAKTQAQTQSQTQTGTIDNKDIVIHIDQNTPPQDKDKDKDKSKTTNDNIFITTNNNLISDDCFFEGVFKVNQFLRVKEYNSNNRFLTQLSKAETALMVFNQYDQAYNSLTDLLSLILSSNRKSIKSIINLFKKNFTVHNYPYNTQGTKEYTELLLIKIYHLLHYIFVKKENYQKQEEMINNIRKLNLLDYYAIFDYAYLKYKQNKLPECFEIIKQGIRQCENDDYKLLMKRFEKMIEDSFKINM